jgi:hypothetical protein
MGRVMATDCDPGVAEEVRPCVFERLSQKGLFRQAKSEAHGSWWAAFCRAAPGGRRLVRQILVVEKDPETGGERLTVEVCGSGRAALKKAIAFAPT